MITDHKSVLCACGGRFTTLEDLDDHISLSFMPDDDIGSDGRTHYETYSDAQRPAIPQDSDEQWMDNAIADHEAWQRAGCPGGYHPHEAVMAGLLTEERAASQPAGDPQDWAAVARAINDRLRELGWLQRELAERSHVSVAVVREIQRHTVERHRNRRTLEALSVALGWDPEHLDRALKSRTYHSGSHATPDNAGLWSRIDSLERRLDGIFKLLTQISVRPERMAGAEV